MIVFRASSFRIICVSNRSPVLRQVSFDEEEGAYLCYEHWPKNTARQFFTVTSLFLQYIVPCSIITFCYAKVCVEVNCVPTEAPV